MTSVDWRGVIAQESDRFAAVLAGTAADAGVPNCPDWTALDLAWHLATVHRFWSEVIARAVQPDEKIEDLESSAPERPATMVEVLALSSQWTGELLEALAAREADDAAWSWFPPDRTVGFTRRMQTHEATIHRVDAEQAAGRGVTPIDPAVAAAGIEHSIDVMWASGAFWKPDWAKDDELGVAEFVAPDVELQRVVTVRRWQGVNPTSGNRYSVAYTRDAGERNPSARIEASAHDLDLWCWGRGDAARIDGDAAGRAALAALREIGMP